MVKRVLVPLDGSATSETILPHLRRLFRFVDCEFELVRVTEGTGTETMNARMYLDALVARMRGELPALKSAALEGTPTAAILGHALNGRFDLIAMTTHGRSGLSRMLHGSVAAELLRTSSVPVFLVRPEVAVSDARTILVPLDGSVRSQEALGPAIALAKGSGGSLVLLTAVPDEGKRSAAAARLERVLEGLDVPAKPVVLVGDPTSAILSRDDAQMIVMATHGGDGVNHRSFGGVTEAVLAKARVPMLVVRTGKAPRGVPRAPVTTT